MKHIGKNQPHNPSCPAPLSPRERRLIAVHLGQKMTAADIKLLTDHLDIDRSSQAELLLLSCIGYEQGWEWFPEAIVPRLKGLHRYYQVHNTIRLPWLIERIHILRKANIPVLLLKGLALRFYYAPGIPRIMGDYDIAVPEHLYEKAIRVLQRNGDQYLGNAPWLYHGVIQGKDRSLEVHSWIFKHHGEKGSDIWERTLPCNLFGEEVRVLCPEDMLLHQLDNRSRDLFENTFANRTAIFVCDCCRIINHMATLDLDKLAARARELHVTNSARRMLLFLSEVLPDRFPLSEIRRAFPFTPDYRIWVKTGLRLRRASERWQSYHYREGEQLTPLRLLRTVSRHYALSRMRTVEMKEMHCHYSFWVYCRDLYRAGGGRTFIQRLGRLSKNKSSAQEADI